MQVKNKILWAQNVTHGMIGKSHDNKQNFVMRPKRLATTESPRPEDWCEQNLLKQSDEMFDQAICNKAKRAGFENWEVNNGVKLDLDYVQNYS